MAGMEKLEGLLPQVLPQVLPCPKSMALDTLKLMAMDFCKQTGVWAAVFEESVCACDRVISPCVPAGAAIESARSLKINGKKLHGFEYEVSGRDIILRNPASESGFAEIHATLRPLRTTDSLPADIYEEYGHIIAIGAVAKLKAMNGQKVEWSDPRGADLNYQLYVEGCCRARARKFRKRFGAGAIYLNTEEA